MPTTEQSCKIRESDTYKSTAVEIWSTTNNRHYKESFYSY